MAFRYAPLLSRAELAWYGRFEVLVTHDPLPREQVAAIHRLGTRLVFYEWSVAVYARVAQERRWERGLLRDSPEAFLNREGLRGGVGDPHLDAFYFDPAAPGSAAERARTLVGRISEAGYDGVFLDTMTGASVHPAALAEYERRHPETPYDAAFAGFLAALRRNMGHRLIFTNQGYRAADGILPYADLDLTESYAVEASGGTHRVRPWNDPARPWVSTGFVINRLVDAVRVRFPYVRFVHLGYVSRRDPAAIVHALATAWLFGDEAYVVAPDGPSEQHEAYFADLGQPLGPLVAAPGGRGAWRVFEHGLAGVNEASEPLFVPPEEAGPGPLRDLLDGTVVAAGRPVPFPAAAPGVPQGRIYLRIAPR